MVNEGNLSNDAISEHVDNAGVHSGDVALVLSTHSIECTQRTLRSILIVDFVDLATRVHRDFEVIAQLNHIFEAFVDFLWRHSVRMSASLSGQCVVDRRLTLPNWTPRTAPAPRARCATWPRS